MTISELAAIYKISPEHIDMFFEHALRVAGSSRSVGRPKVINKEERKPKASCLEFGVCEIQVMEVDGFGIKPSGSALIRFTCEKFTVAKTMTTIEFISFIFDNAKTNEFGNMFDFSEVKVKDSSALRMDSLQILLKDLTHCIKLKYNVEAKRAVADFNCPLELKSFSVSGFSEFNAPTGKEGNDNGDFRI